MTISITQTILLGVVQGLTEFLPVSSSGHLVIFSNFLGLTTNGTMEVFLHAGTMISIIVYYFKSILKLNLNYFKLILIASIPAAVVGFLLSDELDVIFSSTLLVGIALIVTGIMNILTDKAVDQKKKLDIRNTLFIGAFQAIAIIPGISRSGATIFAGTNKKGIPRKTVAQFSFLLSVPAILGANLLVVLKNSGSVEGNLTGYFIGAVSAFLTGLVALRLLEKLLIAGKFRYFGYYCLVVAMLTIFYSIY